MLARCPASTADGWARPRQSSPHRSTAGYPPAPAEYPSGKTTLPRRNLSRSGRPEAPRTPTATDTPARAYSALASIHTSRSFVYRGSVYSITAWPPTMRYLTPFSLKMLNSSSKPEFIASVGAVPMCIDRHLPRRREDRLRTQALPILDVERPVHPGNSPVSFHHEYRSRLFRSSVHQSIVLPEWMDLLSTTPEGASDAGVAEFGPEDP